MFSIGLEDVLRKSTIFHRVVATLLTVAWNLSLLTNTPMLLCCRPANADTDKLAPPGFNQNTAQNMGLAYESGEQKQKDEHAYQEWKIAHNFDDYRIVYNIPLRSSEGKAGDNKALYQQEWEQAASFFTDSAVQPFLSEWGGLEGKSVLDLTPHCGGFSTYATGQGAHVVALAAGPGHREALLAQLQQHGVSTVKTELLPSDWKEALKNPYDIVRINLNRLFYDPGFSLHRDKIAYFEFLLRHVAPNTLLIVEFKGTCLQHRLNLENVSFYDEWKNKLSEALGPDIKGVVFDEESESSFGDHVTAQHRFVACLSRTIGPSLGALPEKRDAIAMPTPTTPHFEYSFDPTQSQFTLSDHGRTWQLGLETSAEKQGIIVTLAAQHSPHHLAFLFEYLNFLLRKSEQREGDEKRLAARETFRVSGNAMIESLLAHLKMYPQFIAQALPLVYGLSHHSYCPKEARRMSQRFLKDVAIQHHDVLAELLAPPRRIWFGRSTFAIALGILADEAQAKDENLFLSILNDSLGPEEGVPSLIYYQERLPDGTPFQCSMAEYYRRSARVEAATALFAIAKKTHAAAVKERIGRGLAEALRGALNASSLKPHKRKIVGPLVTLLGKLGDAKWIDLIKEALAQEMALPSTPRHSRDYFELESNPGFRSVMAVAEIAKSLPEGDQREAALQWIRTLLRDPSYARAPKIMGVACDMLGDLKDAGIREMLEEIALDEKREMVLRIQALNALGLMANPRSIGAFLRLWDQASEWEILEPDFRSSVLEMLGPLAQHQEELRTLDIFTLPESIAARMQGDGQESRGHAAHWLRRFALQDKGSTRFDRVATLLNLRKHAPFLRAELLHERMQAIEKHMPERHWNLLGPLFPQLFGVKRAHGRSINAVKKADFEEFLKRLDTLQRADAAFGMDSMQKALAQYRDNEFLMRATFAHLLLHASLKEIMYEKTQTMRVALESMGIHYDRLINLNDAQKVRQSLAAAVPSLFPKDATDLGSELRKATEHTLNEFMDASSGPKLSRIFADEIVQVFHAHVYAPETLQKNPDIAMLWRDFDNKKPDGVSFMLAPRDLSFFTWGNRCGDCSALGEPIFWTRPVHLLHPCAWSWLVFFNGKLVDDIDAAIFRAGPEGIPVYNLDAHEAVLRSAEGEKADKTLLAARKEILGQAFARITRMARDAGLRHVFGAGWSGRDNVEEYYRESFPRTTSPISMELAGGQSMVNHLHDILSPDEPPAPATVYLQTTSRAGQHTRVQYALDKIEEDIREYLHTIDAWDPLNLAIRTANHAETQQLILTEKAYDELAQRLEPHTTALREHQLSLADGLRLIYTSSKTIGASLPYQLWSAPGSAQPAALSPAQDAALRRQMQMDKLRNSIAEKRTLQRRLDTFVAEALLPHYRRALHDKELQEDLLALAAEFDPVLKKDLAQCFAKDNPQEALDAMQTFLLARGYYFKDGDFTGANPAIQLSRITHILFMPGDQEPVIALKCIPLLGDTSHFIAPDLEMPMLQPIRATSVKAAKTEMRLATAHCIEFMRYWQSDDARAEALATLAEMALSPQPRFIIRLALRQAMAIAKIAKANEAALLLSPLMRAYQAIAFQFFKIVLGVEFNDTALAVSQPTAPGQAWSMSVELSPDEIIAHAKRGLDLLKEPKTREAMRRFAREAYKAIEGEDFHPERYAPMRVEPFDPILFLQVLSGGKAEEFLRLSPEVEHDAFMDHHLLAPRSGFQIAKQRKPQIVPLLAAKPNPDGPFAKGNFDAITDVLLDLRPKEGGGIGDQLMVTPMLVAFFNRFPNATEGGLGFEKAIRIRKHSISLAGEMDNVYAPYLKLCAELGLPFRWGTHEQSTDSIFTGAAYDKAQAWWLDNVIARNTGKRPVVFYNGFGGENENKGYTWDQRRKFAEDVQDTIEQGFFVMLFPNHQPWGNEVRAKAIMDMLPEEQRAHCLVAPEPKADGQLAKYLVGKSELVITVEGGMMHLAYNMGKPFVLLQMPGAGEINWWLSRAISYQRVNFMSAPKSVGELAAETYGRMNGGKLKAVVEPLLHAEMLECAA